LWRALGRAALGLALLVLAPYAWAPVYRFPDPAPFAGSQFWNPYASLTGTWQRANLHAHGFAWAGLTNGEQSDHIVAQTYRGLGYAVAGVSDYQRIAAFHGVDTMPLYEHGFNIGKNHQLAIGAHAVEWFDFPLWQSLSHQQYVIDRVRRKADLVSLNHPSARAYDLNATRSLTGYDLIEVANGPFIAEDVWDSALSSGRPVWAVANDDTHDVEDPRRTAISWNMIDARSASTEDIVAALRAGRSYAVLRTGAQDAFDITRVSSVSVADAVIRVELLGAPSTITFIGQDGTVLRSVSDTLVATYTMTQADTYVRTVVASPQTRLYLNPVIRWDGRSIPAPVASVNAMLTWTQRGAALAMVVMLVLRLRWKRTATRRRALGSAVARRA
jgi:hypothetical protein